MFFEQVSILQKKFSNKYRYFQKLYSNSIDTSKMLFEQYRYFKTCVRTCIDTSKGEFEQVSILQKVSSFTALEYTDLYSAMKGM